MLIMNFVVLEFIINLILTILAISISVVLFEYIECFIKNKKDQ